MRLRLTLWNVGILALVLVTLGSIFSYRLKTAALAAVDNFLADRAHPFDHDRGDRSPPPGPPPPRDPGHRDEFHPRFFDLDGLPLHPEDGSIPWDTTALSQSALGQRVYSTIIENHESIRVLSVPLRSQGAIVGVVQLAASLAPMEQEQVQTRRILLTLIPVALLIAGLGGAFLTDRALRPVRAVTRTAGLIEAQNLSGRLPVKGKDEFAELAATFNGMLDRLERAFTNLEQAYEQQRRFTADASHELRTPLTIIKANSSLALTGQRTGDEYRETLGIVDRAADRTNRIVQDLLLLARADAGQREMRCSPTLLSDILSQALEGLTGMGKPRIALEISPSALCVLGNGDSLVRLFTNLLENAVRHTPPDGHITVSANEQHKMAIVVVTDSGEGIAPDHLPHVLERFYRVDAARTRGGTGLGLAICQSIVEAHGGTISLESIVGRGTMVKVTLPSEPNPAVRTAVPIPVREGQE